ncbi:hypothetical protein PF010_g2931 [Phytophthora fragariae]|uniref:Ankyrin repeat protein n=2 Tax=Phytophthora fragariae TaxID=53985 RepID=A0A6G0LVQ3_9STRA|nr:hypothetical protein PF003_g12147 [Phytophthora fragariae]KAE9133162.1 hypothetical protein PF010_g2931 [Phytophthora fragariae]KAE9351170.1 hypothetical protein PF008_g6083 [Phytophthora fragariae]
MPVTTRARKRVERENTPPANSTKRAQKNKPTNTKRSKAKTSDSQQHNVKKFRAPVPSQYEKLQGATFPLEILALPHVLKRINDLAMRPEEAVIEAVEAGDKKLLKQLTKKFNCNVSDALEFAADNGRHEAVCVLSPEVIGDREYNLNDEVLGALERMAVTAAGNGHYEVVKLLLGEILEERENEHEGEFVYYGYERDIEEGKSDAAWSVLDAAAGEGHLAIVELAAGSVSDDEYLPASERSEALSSAISGGFVDVVEFLLECEQFQWDVYGAFDQAVSEGQHDVATVIYDLYPRRYNDADLFVHLAGAGHLEAVKYLYDNDFSTAKSVEEAFASSVGSACTRTAVANFLLDTDMVSSASFDNAFKKAVLDGSIKAVEFLFGKGRVSPRTVNIAFEKVTKIDMVKLLVKKQSISPKAIEAAFRNSTCQGRFGWGTDTEAILRFLCENDCIPSDVYTEAFLTSVNTRFGGDAMAKVLYAESRISPEVIRAAFKTAADIGHSEIVRFLFDKPAVHQVAKHEAIVSAAQNNQVEVVQLLERSGQWSKDVLASAFKATRNQALKRYLRTKVNVK